MRPDRHDTPPAPRDAPPTPRDAPGPTASRSPVDRIEDEAVPALRACRAELDALAAAGPVGTTATTGLTEHLGEVISRLEQVGVSLRDEDADRSELAELLARCSSDLDGARALVAQSHLLVARDAELLGLDEHPAVARGPRDRTA